jgi:hypothetical protein
MSYVGSPPSTQSFAPGTDTFSGDGTTVAFTLSRNVGTVNDILVVVNNVDQQPTAYTVSVSTLTFTAAPSSGTNNIYVRYLSTNLQTIAPQAGSVGKQGLDVGNSDGTGAAIMPTGTTAQRPSIPLNGMYRLNTTTGNPEWYSATSAAWLGFTQTSSYAIEYLVIAGGGGGGYNAAGGGGGGGYRSSVVGESSGGGASAESQITLTGGTVYTVTIGAGGTVVGGSGTSTNGGNSVFSSITSIGGGGAGSNTSIESGGPGANGGSGGGAAGGFGATSGTVGQGYGGGSSAKVNGSYTIGGGGGGAAAAGGNATSTACGNGGNGVTSSITGSAIARAGGGGAKGFKSGGSPAPGSNGSGGGGDANTGGGGFGDVNGGSGVVIIRYQGVQRGTGGTITSSSGYTIHTFTSSGSYTA